MPITTSTALLQYFQTGQVGPQTWKEIVSHYGPAITSWCRRQHLQSADADEVAQVVLVKMFRRLGAFRYNPAVGFRPYLARLIRSAVADVAEQAKRVGRCDGDASGALQSQAARDDLECALRDRFDQEVLAEAMLRVARRVDAKTWEAFRLQAVEGHAAADVAARLGLTIAAAYKAKSKLQKWLTEMVFELSGEESGASAPPELVGASAP